jgi:hypothetical protein
MNIERLVELYHFVKAAPDEKVAMEYWITEVGTDRTPMDAGETAGEFYSRCGTAACLAGHAVVLFSPEFNKSDLQSEDQARCLLDLDYNTADDLFFPAGENSWTCSKEEALARLQTLIETNGGSID